MRQSAAWRNWYRTVDVRVARPLLTQGRAKVSASLEVFNLFNSNNVAAFNGRQFSAAGTALGNFLQPSSAFAARQTQVGLRAEY